MPELNCFLRYRIGYGTLQPCDAPLERAVILKWFYSLSRRETFVGGKCALPSALLVRNAIKQGRSLTHNG